MDDPAESNEKGAGGWDAGHKVHLRCQWLTADPEFHWLTFLLSFLRIPPLRRPQSFIKKLSVATSRERFGLKSLPSKRSNLTRWEGEFFSLGLWHSLQIMSFPPVKTNFQGAHECIELQMFYSQRLPSLMISLMVVVRELPKAATPRIIIIYLCNACYSAGEVYIKNIQGSLSSLCLGCKSS